MLKNPLDSQLMQSSLTSSKRGANIVASPIRNLIPFADKAKKEGKKIIHLNIGQPDIKTPRVALSTVCNLKDEVIEYGPSAGDFALRVEVAKYYKKFGADLEMEDVFVCTGASEAILFALMATCDEGDELVIPEPFYANYLGFAQLAHVQVRAISCDIKKSFELPPVDEFEKLINPRTKAILLCNPGNPTGQLYSKEELTSILILAKKHRLYVIVDEVYKEFCYDDAFNSILNYQGMEDHVIVIDSISKVFSACGARVGYLITKNNSIRAAVNKIAQLRLCPPFYGQQLALAAYSNADIYIERAREEYKKRREVMYSRISQIKDVFSYKPKAAFYNIVELPVEDAEVFCKWLLTDYEQDRHTLMLAPANGFYFNRELGKRQVRIAYVLEEKLLHQAMDILERALAQYQFSKRE